MVLLDLGDKICYFIENNEYIQGIFLDLENAFDTVNHNILLSKLYHQYVLGVPLFWIKHYLNNRHHYVYINSTKSDKLPVTCGIPQ
jgi:hypothetical protein